MNAILQFRRGAGPGVMLLVLALGAGSAFAQGSPEQYRGRTLDEALRMLQALGLRIVFTSTIVAPELRVRTEPRGTTPREQLDDLLAPHGLKAQDGPGGTIQVVRAERTVVDSGARSFAPATGTIEGRVLDAFTNALLAGVSVRVEGSNRSSRTDTDGRFLVRRVDAGTRMLRASATGYALATHVVWVTPGTTTTITVNLSPAVGTHTEHVTVGRPRPSRVDRGVVSETSLARSQLADLSGDLADQPMRVLHAFPGVSAVDDFRSEFAVRGSPFRHVEVVVDGMSTPWLQHTAYGRGATGSLAMFTGHVLEEATLRAGAYPRRVGDRLGAQLDVRLREGSRTDFKMRGAVGGVNATLVGEGPLGRSQRGSWLAAARQSYLEWPTERPEATRAVFGFSDGFAKLVYDVRPTQQFGVTLLGGTSHIDGEDNASPNGLGDGTNRTSVINLSWRSTFGSTVLSQRGYLVRHHFLNKYSMLPDTDSGSGEEAVYRADIVRPIARGLLEAGAQVGRTSTERHARSDATAGATQPGAAFAGSFWQRASYAHFTWPLTPALTVSPGLRVTDATLMPQPTISRWILGEWAFRAGWTLNASAGVSHQPPEGEHLLRSPRSTAMRAERATHIDVGLEQRVSEAIRWQATVFNRQEADILRESEIHPRLVGTVMVDPDGVVDSENRLLGSSRGFEVLVERRGATGLSGWAAYSYGKTRYADPAHHEAFWADLDQRHALNLFGAYRFASRFSVGATFRTGSNFPIPGYLVARNGGLFVADSRNLVRLPIYSRLDARVERGFEYLGRHLTIFAEVLNVLNRTNVGLANGWVRRSSGEAIGFTDPLFPRRWSAGVLVDF
jgi:Carboxypeptidase regulatory-like domain/TonB dependent receptor-like, beta-barrel